MPKSKLHERLGMDESEFQPRDEQPKKLKRADEESGPYTGDADSLDPPVRSHLPDEPVIASLAVGAGQHKPVDDERFDPVSGRWDVSTAGNVPLEATEKPGPSK